MPRGVKPYQLTQIGPDFGRRRFLARAATGIAGVAAASAGGIVLWRWRAQASSGEAPPPRPIDASFVALCRERLEQRLKSADPEDYAATHAALKLYLMLRDPRPHAYEREWAATELTHLQLEIAGPANIEVVYADVIAYLEGLPAAAKGTQPLDEDLIARVRAGLQSVSLEKRLWERIVTPLDRQKVSGPFPPDDDATRLFSGTDLGEIFAVQPGVLDTVKSRRFVAGKGYPRVIAAFTPQGHAAVNALLRVADGLLEAESWVVPRAPSDTAAALTEHAAALRAKFEARYVEAWRELFLDIVVTTPRGPQEAHSVFRLLRERQPYRQLLARLARGVLPPDESAFRRDALARSSFADLNGLVDHCAEVQSPSFAPPPPMWSIQSTFASVLRFDLERDGGKSDFDEYVSLLRDLDHPLEPDRFERTMREGRAKVRKLVAGYDENAKEMLLPLLLLPLSAGATYAAGTWDEVQPADISTQ